ncbi:MAG: ribonuclease HII [Lachnospiraceae bacterium]|nr:ribonuclease HII [Lachnospiraceae bacterium]
MSKSINDIKKEFEAVNLEEVTQLIDLYKEDTRAGVVKLIQSYENKLAKLEEEKERIKLMKTFENDYLEYEYVCGIDEVGRGPLAGPVVAAVVVLPKDCEILYVNDSKQLSEKKREELYDIIIEEAVDYGVGIVYQNEIDEINILEATYKAMRIAISNLSRKPDVLLNDAVTIPGIDEDVIQVPIIKGDAKSLSIAAASIVAKVIRDRMMVEYAKEYPQYGFDSNKGYGAKAHIDALKEIGPCPLHRRSFIKNFVKVEL